MSFATTIATRIGGNSSREFDRLIKQAAGSNLTAVNMNGAETLYLFSDTSSILVSPEQPNGFKVNAPQGYEPPQVAASAPEPEAAPKKAAPKTQKKTPFTPPPSD